MSSFAQKHSLQPSVTILISSLLLPIISCTTNPYLGQRTAWTLSAKSSVVAVGTLTDHFLEYEGKRIKSTQFTSVGTGVLVQMNEGRNKGLSIATAKHEAFIVLLPYNRSLSPTLPRAEFFVETEVS
jgi:hypothetical protein